QLLPRPQGLLVTTPPTPAPDGAARAAATGPNTTIRLLGVGGGSGGEVRGSGGRLRRGGELAVPLLATVPLDPALPQHGGAGAAPVAVRSAISCLGASCELSSSSGRRMHDSSSASGRSPQRCSGTTSGASRTAAWSACCLRPRLAGSGTRRVAPSSRGRTRLR